MPPGRQTRRSSAAAFVVIGREHRAEDGGDGIEGRVRERQCLGVALDELDLEPLGGRPLAALLEQGRHVVDADGRAAEPGGRDRRVAAAGGDVEDAPAGVQVGGVAELLGDDLDLRRDDGEVAARPGLLLPLLDRPEVWGRCFGDACHVGLLSSLGSGRRRSRGRLPEGVVSGVGDFLDRPDRVCVAARGSRGEAAGRRDPLDVRGACEAITVGPDAPRGGRDEATGSPPGRRSRDRRGLPTTLLPSLACQRGPPKWVVSSLPLSPKSSARGADERPTCSRPRRHRS